jgi:hypothetical protein
VGIPELLQLPELAGQLPPEEARCEAELLEPRARRQHGWEGVDGVLTDEEVDQGSLRARWPAAEASD